MKLKQYFDRPHTDRAPNATRSIVGLRRRWYILSASLLLPAVVVLAVFGLKLGIDFTGGAVIELDRQIPRTQLEDVAGSHTFEVASVTVVGERGQLISYRDRGGEGFESRNDQFHTDLSQLGANIARFERVGPSVSADITRNALLSIGVLSLAIILYIAWAFRNIPPPVKAVHFGVIAVIALLHDALIVVGIFAILGQLLGIEVDSFFVTAVLTVIAFSIHDTIVVFDRVRENLIDKPSAKFEETVATSVNEVMVRSLNTSVVVIVVLMGLLLFGGLSIRYFVLALLVGMVSGTYSSIFIASPLLVSWRQFRLKRISK